MSLHEVLKAIDAKFYPDIAHAGSISVALSKSLADVGSSLVADATEVDDFMPYAKVEKETRFSQISLAGGERLFLVDFWSEGVIFGNGSTPELSDVARAINAWIVDKSAIEKMLSNFDFFSPTESGKAHEGGVIVEHKWQNLLEYWKGEKQPIGTPDRNPAQLIEAAMKRPILRQLFPYTSLISLCFSRTTGYPFTNDCPRIEPQGNGKYFVYAPDTFDILGEGLVEDVLDILINHLPPNCGSAVNGTADDFIQ